MARSLYLSSKKRDGLHSLLIFSILNIGNIIPIGGSSFVKLHLFIISLILFIDNALLHGSGIAADVDVPSVDDGDVCVTIL